MALITTGKVVKLPRLFNGKYFSHQTAYRGVICSIALSLARDCMDHGGCQQNIYDEIWELNEITRRAELGLPHPGKHIGRLAWQRDYGVDIPDIFHWGTREKHRVVSCPLRLIHDEYYMRK